MAAKSLLAKPPTGKRSPNKSRDSVEIVQDWDRQFEKQWNGIKNDLTKLNQYADKLMENNELENAFYTVLDDFKINEKLLESICKFIFAYRSTKCEKLHQYVLNYVPSLMSLTFQASVTPLDTRKKFKCVEACLLNIYNKEIVDEEGKPKKVTMRIPELGKPSIYHNTPLASPSTANLTEQTLKFLESSLPDKPIPTFGPYEQVEKLNASNRSKTMTVLLRVYYQNLNVVSKNSWKVMCRVALKMLKMSGPRSATEQAHAISVAKAAVAAAEKTPSGVMTLDEMFGVGLARIQLESPWFVEVLRCVYVFLYNGVTDLGTKVLQQVHTRATQQLWTDVMLMSNAMINSFKIDPNPHADAEPDLSGSRSDVRSPISTILTATTSYKTPTTAATFKPSKLPEDIPIVGLGPPSEASTDITDDNTRSTSLASPASRPTSSLNRD